METPSWLTVDYIADSLRKFYKDENLIVHTIDTESALGKGENYGGILTRVTVKFERLKKLETKKLLLKSCFENDEFCREKMAPYDIFNREMSIYENVLPKLNELLKKIKDTDQLFAVTLRVDYERQALLFEDLSDRGFVMPNRIDCLDLDHIKLVLRKIAKMHATSAVLNERSEFCLELFDRGFFNRYTDIYSPFFVGTLIACAQYVNSCAGFEQYAKKLFALEPYYMEIGKRCFEPLPHHINVLAHGDLWTNNLMFRYESGKPKDVILIDFQYTFWGSPALDLHYFFNTSLKEDLRLHLQDTLFQFYYTIFSNTLKKLNYRRQTIPSLHRFRVHAEEKRFYAFHSACVIQPLMLNEDSEDASFNTIMNTDERSLKFKSNLYKNPRVQDNLNKLLPVFEQSGFLDVNQCD